MRRPMPKQVTIDPEAWARNLRVAPDATPDDDAGTRWLNNYFAVWVICETAACKRAKRCADDAAACRDRFWPHVPERMKFEFRAMLKAIDEGLSLDGVMRKVKEELARFDEITRVLGTTSGACQAPSPALASREHPLPQAGEGKLACGIMAPRRSTAR